MQLKLMLSNVLRREEGGGGGESHIKMMGAINLPLGVKIRGLVHLSVLK